MKKIKKVLFIVFVMCFMTNIYASSFAVTVSCPSTAKAGSTVSCKLSTTFSGFKLRGLEMHYSFDNCTYSNFSLDSGFKNLASNTKTGLMLDRSTPVSSKATIGTLKIKMPSSGTAKITFSGIEATNENASSSYSTSNITKNIKVASSVNTLDSLSVEGYTLSPTFSKNTTSYTLTKSVNDSSITIKASKTSSVSSVSGTGKKSLSYGDNTFKVVVTAESGDKKTYTIKVNRPDTRENINTLKSLSVDGYQISPSFESGTTTYNLNVENKVSSIKVNASLTSSKSSFTSGYGPRTVKLNYGSNKVQIRVKAENKTEKIYTINVNRKDNRDNNNYLSSLSTSYGKIKFDKNTTSYDITVPYEVSSIDINAALESDKSKLSGTGKKNLIVGSNKLEVVVTAQNETKNTYIINVKRLKEGEKLIIDYIDTLSITNASLDFDSEQEEYYLVVDDIDSLDFKYTLNEGISASLEGNNSLESGSVVKLILSDEDNNQKIYKFNVFKKNGSCEALDLKKQTTKVAIITSIIMLVLFAIVVGIYLYLKRKKENSISSESSNIDENTFNNEIPNSIIDIPDDNNKFNDDAPSNIVDIPNNNVLNNNISNNSEISNYQNEYNNYNDINNQN